MVLFTVAGSWLAYAYVSYGCDGMLLDLKT